MLSKELNDRYTYFPSFLLPFLTEQRSLSGSKLFDTDGYSYRLLTVSLKLHADIKNACKNTQHANV